MQQFLSKLACEDNGTPRVITQCCLVEQCSLTIAIEARIACLRAATLRVCCSLLTPVLPVLRSRCALSTDRWRPTPGLPFHLCKQPQLVPITQRHSRHPHPRHHLRPFLMIQPSKVQRRLKLHRFQLVGHLLWLRYAGAYYCGQKFVVAGCRCLVCVRCRCDRDFWMAQNIGRCGAGSGNVEACAQQSIYSMGDAACASAHADMMHVNLKHWDSALWADPQNKRPTVRLSPQDLTSCRE